MITRAVADDENAIIDARLHALRMDPLAFYRVASDESDEDEGSAHRGSVKQFFDPNRSSAFFICKQVDSVEGMVGLEVPSDLRFRHVATLSWFWVMNTRRGTGLGQMLFKTVLDYAVSLNFVEKIQLTVMSTQERAIAMYRKGGFETVATLKKHVRYPGGYQDTLVMEKII